MFIFFEGYLFKYDETVVIQFESYNKRMKVNNPKNKIKTSYLERCMTEEGIAGFSGYFKGHFLLDKQRPPIKAKLKVLLGYITLHLETWGKWSPAL